MVFSKILINWYLKNKRDLPWRETKGAYPIWLSEIILQQTRVEQGLPYYYSFVEAFPTVFDLANASQDQVLKLWQGLGYYSRARNLHETAKYVAYQLNGGFPKTYNSLIKLKGVGDYTASAIASFCYNESVAVVDGNVYRVLARYFDIDTAINSAAGIKEFRDLAYELLDKTNPSVHNQAIMEFGALQCRPKNPLCATCPFNESCLALKNDKIAQLPVKLKKGVVKKRHFNYFVFQSEANHTLLQQRTGKGIWNGLYEFPLIETSELAQSDFFPSVEALKGYIGSAKVEFKLYNEIPIVHKLSHQHIYTRFWIVKAEGGLKEGIPVKKIKDYPVPVLIENFLNEFEMADY